MEESNEEVIKPKLIEVDKEVIDGFKVEENTSGIYKRWLYLIVGVLALFCFSYVVKGICFPEKQCMQWQIDHYEKVDCQNEINSLYSSSPIIPFDKKIIELHKLTVCDTTTFFKGGKPVVWYCKVNSDSLDFFDTPGFHPISEKSLKPITEYIIGKYVESCK